MKQKTKSVAIYIGLFLFGLIIGLIINNLAIAGNATKAINQNLKDQLTYKDALHTNQEYLEKYQIILKMQGAEYAKQLNSETINYLRTNNIKPDDLNNPELQGIFSCEWWCKHFPATWIIQLICGCEKPTLDVNNQE